MDFSVVELTPEQQVLEQELRAMILEYVTPDPAHYASSHDVMPVGLRRALVNRGWIHGALPADSGGADFGEIEGEILEQVFDDLRAPFDDIADLVIPVLEKHASPWLREHVEPGIRSGELTCCLGYSEPDSGSDMAAAKTRAVRDGDTWVINGQKMWTTFGDSADFIFLLARTGDISEKHRSLTMFLVPLDTPGFEARPVWILGGGYTNITFFTDVTISDDYRLGPVNEGWTVMSEPLAAEHGTGRSAEGVAPINGQGDMASRALGKLIDVTIAWADSRRDCDGRTRLEDPVVRNAIAEAMVDLEMCWNAEGMVGKPICSEALARNADLLGNIAAPESLLDVGVDGAFEAGLIAGERQHAPGLQIYGGTTEIFRNNLARSLGLPRPY